jgi:Flp pilus assembly protein TadG
MNNHQRGQSGQATVEFALSLPLLVLLLFSIIQYGFIFSASITLRHAANATARSLALAGASTNNATAIAAQFITPALDNTKLAPAVVKLATISSPNDAITVQLTYNLPLIVSFVVPGSTNGKLALKSQGTYRKGG